MRRALLAALVLVATVDLVRAQGGPEPVYAAALTIRNPLVMRYRMRFPPSVHIQLSDGTQAWTCTVENNEMKLVDGLFGSAHVTLRPSREEMKQVYEFVREGRLAFTDKVTMIDIFARVGEKPIQPPPPGRTITGIRLTPVEERILQIGRYSAKIRWLFHKIQTAPNRYWQIFWGIQVKILTLVINKFTERLTDDLWDGIDQELDRGEDNVVPAGTLDLTVNVVGMHVMFKDEDMPSYKTLLDNLKKRLVAEMAAVGDYPPDQQERRRSMIQRRLDPVGFLLEKVQE